MGGESQIQLDSVAVAGIFQIFIHGLRPLQRLRHARIEGKRFRPAHRGPVISEKPRQLHEHIPLQPRHCQLIRGLAERHQIAFFQLLPHPRQRFRRQVQIGEQRIHIGHGAEIDAHF